MKNDISGINRIATTGSIKKIINIIDRVKKRKNFVECEEGLLVNYDESIAYLCRHRLRARNSKGENLTFLLRKVEKYSNNLDFRKKLEAHRVYLKVKSNWTNEKVHNLINKKRDLLGLLNVNDEKIEEVKATRPDLMRTIDDFFYIFPIAKREDEEGNKTQKPEMATI